MRTLDRAILNTLEGVKLPKWQLKNIIGGCDPIDGGTLDDVIITCDQNPGQCWKCSQDSNEHPCSEFTGDQKDYCSLPWKCID